MLPETPSYSSQNICGAQISISQTQAQLTTLNNDTPLMNGTTYIVAIAAYDEVFNLGPLAPLQCGKPQIIDSYYNTYCADGGPGCMNGCGSCNVGGGGTDPLWPVLGAGALAAVGIMVRRDRRRRAPGVPRSRNEHDHRGAGIAAR
jgi:MYXO-CTERM domain-containing protein